jgi:acyl carrier protein
MYMNDEQNPTLLIVKTCLADHIGVNVEDINDDDTFMNDLHMRPTEFSDFIEELTEKGLDTRDLDLTSIQTVGDLVESLSSHIYTS